jgi:DNA repair exonuclease SbcCD nuclease subunit
MDRWIDRLLMIQPEPEPELKSRRLAFYDIDKQKTKTRKFSKIEISLVNKIFDTVREILLENKLTIRNKKISSGLCRCHNHNNTYFIIELQTNMVEPDTINKVEDALKANNCKLIRIVARQEKDQTFIVLVILLS